MFKNVYSLYSAFFTQPAFYSQSAVCLSHSVCILPLVRSLQSVRFDQGPIGHFKVKKKKLCSKRGSKRLNLSF